MADCSRLNCYPLDYTTPHVCPSSAHGPNPAPTTPPVWLLLCSARDPMNLGSTVRTAHYLGVERLLLAGPRPALSCIVSKASAGALEMTPVWAVKHPLNLVQVGVSHSRSVQWELDTESAGQAGRRLDCAGSRPPWQAPGTRGRR